MSRRKKRQQRQLAKGTPATNAVIATVTPAEPLRRLHDITSAVKVPKLVLSKEILEAIDYCHSKIGNIEWSGTLLYKLAKKDFKIQDLYNKELEEDIIINVDKFLLRDIGSHSLTEYELSTEQLVEEGDYRMEGYRLGLIHTHHNMTTFFSGTDQKELQDNTPHHELYISLIVNHAGDYKARLCFKGTLEDKKETVHKFKFSNILESVISPNSKQEEVIFFIDLEIIKSNRFSVPQELENLVKNLLEEKAKARTRVTTYSSNNGIGYSKPSITPGLSSLANTLNKKRFLHEEVNEVVRRMEAIGHETSIDVAYGNLAPFMFKWCMGDLEARYSNNFYNYATTTLAKLSDTEIDVMMDKMHDNIEEFFLQYFGIDDEPLLTLEIIMICESILCCFNHPPYTTMPFMKELFKMLDDKIEEEEESWEEEQEDTLNEAIEADRELDFEGDDFGNLVCPSCDDGLVKTGSLVTMCKRCGGIGLISPVPLVN